MSYKSDFEDATGWNTVDTNKKLTSRGGDRFINFLKDNGVHTIIRYYASSKRAKTISLDEAKLITSEGFAILPVYQDINRLATDFSEGKGKASARNALGFAEWLDQPDGSTILFAVDSDLSSVVIDKNVIPYFEGIRSEMARLGRAFRIGVYGSGHACRTLIEKGLVEVPWLSMSRSFLNTKDFFYSNEWMLRQIPLDIRHSSGFSYDRNLMRVRQGEIGAFTYDSNDDGVVVGGSMIKVPSTQPAVPIGTPEYPGQVISMNSGDGPGIVELIQRRLNEVGYGPVTVDGDFGTTTRNVVRDFQAENDDLDGDALDVDGEVGKLTWGALFHNEDVDTQVPDISGIADLSKAFIEVCRSQIGVKEDLPYNNRGPRVDGYIRSTGLEPYKGSFPWCIAYLYWCGLKLCEQRNIVNPMPKTAGVHRMWDLGQNTALDIVNDAQADSSTVRPGMLFFIDKGRGRGHAGMVAEVNGDKIITIEGNTNKGGVREGYGVFQRTRKLNMASLMGYLDFWDAG